MNIIKAPAPIPHDAERPLIFLAGSIEQGSAPDWQGEVDIRLAEFAGTLLNPRRDQWNPALRQDKDEPEFRQQVEWELKAMERADVVLMYFAPGTQAPISLLEFGLQTGLDTGFNRNRLLVGCPAGYWRKGNVDIVCELFDVPECETLEDAVATLVEWCGGVENVER